MVCGLIVLTYSLKYIKGFETKRFENDIKALRRWDNMYFYHYFGPSWHRWLSKESNSILQFYNIQFPRTFCTYFKRSQNTKIFNPFMEYSYTTGCCTKVSHFRIFLYRLPWRLSESWVTQGNQGGEAPHHKCYAIKGNESHVGNIQFWFFNITNLSTLNATFWSKSHLNRTSGCRDTNILWSLKTMKNIRICHIFKPVTQNQYSRHPTHSPWSCHKYLNPF